MFTINQDIVKQFKEIENSSHISPPSLCVCVCVHVCVHAQVHIEKNVFDPRELELQSGVSLLALMPGTEFRSSAETELFFKIIHIF